MDIFQIWAFEDGIYWLVDAFDTESLAETDDAYIKAKATAISSYGADNVRVIVQSINMYAVERAFEPPRIPAGVIRTPEEPAS